MLLSADAGGDVADDEVDAVEGEVNALLAKLLPNIDCDATPFVAPFAVAAAFEALVPLLPLHPVSMVDASSREQTVHDPRAPTTRPS
jgi:hypothetical protein